MQIAPHPPHGSGLEELPHQMCCNTFMREIRLYGSEGGGAERFLLQTMADKAGMDKGHLGDIERGQHDLSTGTLERIARALRMKVSEFTRRCRLIGTETQHHGFEPAKTTKAADAKGARDTESVTFSKLNTGLR